MAAYQRRAQTRGGHGNMAPGAESKSPDKYTINKNLVVNLNDSVIKPVKRENSNTTNATGITAVTGATASTAVSGATQNQLKNKAFYNTQYNGKGFFPQTKDKNSHNGPPGTAGSIKDNNGARFRSINATGTAQTSGHNSPNQSIDIS